MKFIQVDNYGRKVDKFDLKDLGWYIKLQAEKLKVGEEIQFTGTTVLKRTQ